MKDPDRAAEPGRVRVARRWNRYTSTFVAVPAGPGTRDRLRAAAGAIAGIALTGGACSLIVGSGLAHPLLVAPMGASAVLAFAVPASPLAQPWAIVGGNTLSAVVGITAALLLPSQMLAAALAVGTAILAMSLFRCLHPPGGAVALSSALAGAHGYGFALSPVALNSILLVVAAMAFHRLTGHSYPHVALPPPPAPTPVEAEDVAAALAGYGDTLDIAAEDLLSVIRAAEAHAADRRSERS